MKVWACFACIVVCSWWFRAPPLSSGVAKWLSEQNLSIYAKLISQHGVRGMLDLADERAIPVIPGRDGERLVAASHRLYNKLVLNFWLVQVRQEQQADTLAALNIESLDDLLAWQDLVLKASPGLVRATAKLAANAHQLDSFKRQLFEEMRAAAEPANTSWGALGWVAAAVSAALLADLVYRLTRDAAGRRALAAPLQRLLQMTVRCSVQLRWQDRRRVGGTVSLSVQAWRLDGGAYCLEARASALEVRVRVGDAQVACAIECRGSSATCTFPVRAAGVYHITVTLAGRHVAHSPYTRHFLADLPEAGCCCVLSHSSTVVMTQGQPYPMLLDMRDGFHNGCERADWPEVRPRLAVAVSELDSVRPVVPYEQVELDGRRVRLRLVLSREGCFRAKITYDGQPIRNGDFYLIVLSAYNMTAVRKHVEARGVSFSATLTAVDGRPLNKRRDVWCAVSPKQLTVRDTLLFFIPRKLYTFRLCPSTRLTPSNENNAISMPSLLVTDGCQPTVELALKDRDTMAATFAHFLLRNVGGSETFADKQRHFYRELERRLVSGGRARRRLTLAVRRAALLESSMAALRGASASDWARPFEIKFDDEGALDYGGVRREWFELLCQEMFEPRTKLFIPLDESDQQALVHPNWRRPPALKLRHFEFAGRVVGKCLLESSQGAAARQLVRANFSRSFLAQLIGLRVTYKHFEQDDRELYRTKVTLIESCSAEELAAFDLAFTDEEFDDRGRLLQTVELRPGGARTSVTIENRLEYLQSLAQYRLSTRSRAEVDAFLRGLNELVPDQLLSIFDENELELLMCGSSQFSVADLRRHHAVTDHSAGFQHVIQWFWTALDNFTAEETSRLLQFTTGCARLPAGGFADLLPNFQISSHHEFGALPVAHTCFNQICLPDHNNYEEFERALLLALREGNVGFGLL